MRRNHNTLRRQNESGFTLIEVTLALAVALIGMIAVLGLLPQGLQSSREAADNTISATIANQVFATVRSQAFNKVDFVDLDNNASPIDLTSYTTPAITLYFDQRGTPTNIVNGIKGYFQANVQFLPPTPNPGSLTTVTVTVIWPALAKSPVNTNIFVSTVTAYP